ncbi:MAG: DUF5946 family protein [Maritimibacter sp.]
MPTNPQDMQRCIGCGSLLPASTGPVHAYMASSPGCYEAFNTLIAAEFSAPWLMQIHRLTVDTWAVQHPGSDNDRRAIQSVGLHLARLYVQLTAPRPPRETNAVMLDFARHKKTLIPLTAPERFSITVDQVAPFAGGDQHIAKVTEWAEATWQDWSAWHDYIRGWIRTHSVFDLV